MVAGEVLYKTWANGFLPLHCYSLAHDNYR